MRMESGIPGVRNRVSVASGPRGKAATGVLTGNPGSPGMPSGPCDTRKTKGGFRNNSRPHRSTAPPGPTPPSTSQRLKCLPTWWGSRFILQKRMWRPGRGQNWASSHSWSVAEPETVPSRPEPLHPGATAVCTVSGHCLLLLCEITPCLKPRCGVGVGRG